MGVFGKNASKSSEQSKRTIATIIAQGCSVYGNIQLACDMHVDGFIEGNISSEKSITVSPSGKIKGEIKADKLILNGVFEGNCYTNIVEILAQGKAKGAIYTDDLSIEKGGNLLGNIYSASEEKLLTNNDFQKVSPEIMEIDNKKSKKADNK